MSTKRDWRYAIGNNPMSSYTYNADVYCGGCTAKIKKELDKEGKTPANPDNESSYDSDDYPKSNDGLDDSSDTPQHCGSHAKCVNAIRLPCGTKIGGWLGNSLTSDGIEYTVDAVWSDLVVTSKHQRQVGRLWRHLYRDQLKSYEDEPREVDRHGISAARAGFTPKHYYVDLDAVYVIGTNGTKVEVLRYEADANGNFPKKPQVAATDPATWKNKSVQSVLETVIYDTWR